MSRPLRHHPSPGDASRRARNVGYLVAVVVNSILLLMVNARPGRRVLPFLTEDFVGILWLVNLSLVASAGVNVVYLWYGSPWFKSVCQVGVSAVGLATAIRTLQIFPFDFSASAHNWAALTGLVLAVAIFGSVVAIVVELARLANRGINAGVRLRSPIANNQTNNRLRLQRMANPVGNKRLRGFHPIQKSSAGRSRITAITPAAH